MRINEHPDISLSDNSKSTEKVRINENPDFSLSSQKSKSNEIVKKNINSISLT